MHFKKINILLYPLKMNLHGLMMQFLTQEGQATTRLHFNTLPFVIHFSSHDECRKKNACNVNFRIPGAE